MTLREILLAELEAKRRAEAEDPVEVLDADLLPGADDGGYDPYDNPSHAKPLDVERPAKRTRRLNPR
jgi:hypothetical protein